MKEIEKETGSDMRQVKTYIGIDNGTTGSIGIINDYSYDFLKVPVKSCKDYSGKKSRTRIDHEALKDILRPYAGRCKVGLEYPLVNPRLFIATCSGIAAYEAVLVVCEQFNIPVEMIPAKKWQKCYSIKGNTKILSAEIGKSLYPAIADKIDEHKDADGILIADFLKNKLTSL